MGNTIINCQQGDSPLPKQSLLCLPTLYVAKHQNILAVKHFVCHGVWSRKRSGSPYGNLHFSPPTLNEMKITYTYINDQRHERHRFSETFQIRLLLSTKHLTDRLHHL